MRPVIRADSGPSATAMQWQECFPMAARTGENETLSHPSRLGLGNGKRPYGSGGLSPTEQPDLAFEPLPRKDL